MFSLIDALLESNSKIKLNFDGDDLSSNTELFLLKEFVYRVGLDKIIEDNFKTNDSASYRTHEDDENLMQKVYQTIAGYFQDNDADEFIKDPVFKEVFEKVL